MKITFGEARQYFDEQAAKLNVELTDENILLAYISILKALRTDTDYASRRERKDERQIYLRRKKYFEVCYPWVREAAEAQKEAQITDPVTHVDVIGEAGAKLKGIAILRHARHKNRDEIYEWIGFAGKKKPAEQLNDVDTFVTQIIEDQRPTLAVLLVHLWHYAHLINGETPVRVLRVNRYGKANEAMLTLESSAIALSTFLERLG
jgi:hypothetical protein